MEDKDVVIHITDRDGVSHQVKAPTDMNLNLMEVIRLYELAPEGTLGVCGGMAMCASCQCYIDSNHYLQDISDDESAMLSEAFHVLDTSRLSCQIPIDTSVDGLKITMAPQE